MSSDPPMGRPYSQVYVERGPASEDSPRFRNRLRGYLGNQPHSHREEIADAVRQETGARVDAYGVSRHFEECSLTELLDCITHATAALRGVQNYGQPHPVAKWLQFVDRALKEENVAYRVDHRGGIHPAFDDEFIAKRRATVAGLEGPRYAAVLDFYESSIEDLKPPYNTRDAVRKSFEAAENLAKLMVPIARLTPTEVEKQPKPLVLVGLIETEKNAANLMLNGFAAWVAACQQYRHASGKEQPDAPSLELALWMVSDGAAHLRWLANVDKKLIAARSNVVGHKV